MRTLAIDLGTRRIGLALSDQSGTLATPIDVLAVASADQAIAPISQLVIKEVVEQILLGLPLNMDGTIGPQAKRVMAWASDAKGRIEAQAKRTVAMVFVDERLSSFDAEQQLIARRRGGEKITRKAKKQMLDALVAAALLQEFLDGKLPPIHPPPA